MRGGHEREAFLADACAGDDALRREVESLLAHDGGAAFLSTPAVAHGIGGGIRIGQALGPYVISAQIGKGGMGEVYRARDPKLGRDVAIKVLPEAFAADADRVARFQREARTLASLDHPNIAIIHGLELGGTPASLVEHIQTTGTSASDVAGAFTVSETGVLAYQTGSVVRSQLTWFDRAGTRLATLGDQADYIDVALSPDDTRVAVSLMDVEIGTRDLWIFDVARRLRERFTYESGDDFGPNWSRPGGDRIFFSSQRKGSIDLYEKPSSGSGSETLLLKDDLGKFNASSSPDGRFLMYVGGGGVIGRSDIWVLSLFGERKPAPFLETRFLESQGQFSPDGRWVAFMSSKSGEPEVYVTPFPGSDTEQQVSTAGGSVPRWNRNGKEIFYLAPDNILRVTPVNGQTSRFDVGTGRPLFSIHPRPARLDAYPYDVTSDGQRILVNTFVDEVTPPISLIVNWEPKR